MLVDPPADEAVYLKCEFTRTLFDDAIEEFRVLRYENVIIKSHPFQSGFLLQKRTAFGGDAGSSVSTDAHQSLLSQGQKQF